MRFGTSIIRSLCNVGEMRNAHTILVGKPESKKMFEKTKLRWENNMRIYLGE
jgi:hypothetical protein